MEPGFDQRGPVRNRKGGWPETITMASFRVDVKLSGDFELFECLRVNQYVFYVDGIIFGLQ